MNFQFDSLDAFLIMNGHGVYVWACYIITFSVLTFLVVSPMLQRKSFLKQQKKNSLLQKNVQ
ncbi:MAG: heme exporter protein CcmD [Pseudomonadota bacterium]